MEIALPVAVKFLNKDNKELSRNLASYLSLVSIEFICPYVNTILDSLLSGNYSLSRVILQLYDIASETINQATRALIDVLQKCDTQDKNNLLQLIATIIKSNSSTNNIIDKLPQFFDLILIPTAGTLKTKQKISFDYIFHHFRNHSYGCIDCFIETGRKEATSVLGLH